ncbi:ABC transporter substrate-binding protein [Tumebacillus sp. ITR2]|uniref:ABC transporter substrate-binding protein n=1 Tax=Tumebacillus amylolyticus TaxID=2801339 RepID=A0ABS1J539_9BACL|nr:ABC transporter substrate-binding protein [Tumebacillus amylolyticus]MBL0385390.1 ABC transporter substrate-binding protein [Tumebacillus amylolyticus]
MKKKNVITGILATTLAMTALVGCSSSTSDTSDKGSTSGDKFTLRVGGWSSSPQEQAMLDKQIAGFKEKHPNIDVKFEPVVGDYLQKLQPMIASKTEPDIFYLDANVAPDFMDKGVIEPIDDLVKKHNVNLSDYEDAAVQAFQWNGKTYGLPKDYNTLALFYNKEMFDKAGITAPPKTWDELKTDAAKLTKDGVTGFSISAELPRYQPFLVQAGGSVYTDGKPTLNNPANTTALDFIYKDMMGKDKIAAYPKTLGVDWSGDAFATNKAAMVVEGSWLIPHMAQKAPNTKYGIAELPVKEGGKPSNMIFTVAYALSKNSKHKDDAMDLMAYLTGTEGQKVTVEGGLALPTIKAMGKEYSTKYPEREAFVKGASYAQPFQYGVIGSKLTDAANKAAEAIVLGAQPDGKAALEEAQGKLK